MKNIRKLITFTQFLMVEGRVERLLKILSEAKTSSIEEQIFISKIKQILD